MTRRTFAIAVTISAVGLLSAPAAVAVPRTDETVTLADDTFEVGQPVEVSGDGWAPGEQARVVVCGNAAANGSSDCDEAGGFTNMIWPDGTLHALLDVRRPPSDCPCVVRVSGEQGVVVDTPVKIAGVPTARPAAGSSTEPRRPELRVTEATVTSKGSPLSPLTGRPRRMLRVEVRNMGDLVAAAPLLTVAWGRPGGATTLVAPTRLDDLAPGEAQVVEVPVKLDLFSFGSYEIRGEVGVTGARAEFETATSAWPWGLLVVLGIVVAQCVALVARNRLRRRIAEPQDPDEPIDGPESRVGADHLVGAR